VQASSSLVRSRKGSDGKLDFSHITVELQTVDGLVKDSTQCAPNGYYFIPVYDKGSFILKINGPDGWSWNPDKVNLFAIFSLRIMHQESFLIKKHPACS
jgi:long-subunit fatty acid transport protein